ncbi:helix-turn-helix domain-containing protein [Biostraticola tofi]|uniref:AraC-like DNA-binding protein n=1 Tax=Biostraticola tofi TaxID=466109 RepID=A0A4R3YS12_9GAMM|nr:helix-turn-helix domain-containing protein [Biostraticola tofi]TCV95152.1 AraC-like DNA-binding protein [Biostraticola tofi]
MYYQNVVNDMLKWIEANLEETLNLQVISVKTGFSKWYLQRLFKRITGYSLGSYMRKRRLSMAAVRLMETREPILTIAFKYQFDSQSSFNRAFKRHFHITPSEYRLSSRPPANGLQWAISLPQTGAWPDSDADCQPASSPNADRQPRYRPDAAHRAGLQPSRSQQRNPHAE